ncbi:hypothetical protein PIIN_11024 [Serendipita indica DSM 11827]|uniref:Uncharacterized protein n=1 Tax=Serendipita indica (strain DSM 11827) TaxID=1109443 RepID=G4U0E6_SERID|nr:hypothetical protein PIIN_11024 [Serendipita indica DSM 11827]
MAELVLSVAIVKLAHLGNDGIFPLYSRRATKDDEPKPF